MDLSNTDSASVDEETLSLFNDSSSDKKSTSETNDEIEDTRSELKFDESKY